MRSDVTTDSCLQVCFDLFTAYFADRSVGPENMLDQAKWLKTDHDVLVLDDAKPVRCEVIVPPSLYREDPETIVVTEIDQDFLKQAASPELCEAYGTFRADFHHFDRIELDLRGKAHVWGAALSCPRLKWADMVLI